MTVTPTRASARPQAHESALPPWQRVLAVVAHPDDETFALGALLDAFAVRGAAVSVLCLTHGEASTVHGVAGDLSVLRAAELAAAGKALGLGEVVLLDHRDGHLSDIAPRALAAEVLASLDTFAVEGVLVFDPSGVTAHDDHRAATAAAMTAAGMRALPVIGWTIPREVAEQLNAEFGAGFVGHDSQEIDLTVAVDRDRQRVAALAHASQAIPSSLLWRRLELLGDVESVRWLRRPGEPESSGAEVVPRPVARPHEVPSEDAT